MITPNSAQDVSIIIVNWNTRELLTQCLESLPSACGSLNFKIIVVDNASEDGSPEWIRERFPLVTLVANSKNVGFAAANNQAAGEAVGRYLLLLNPDTQAAPNSIKGLVRFADAHPESGAIGPRLLNSNGTDQRSCWRNYPGIGMALLDALYLWKLPWVPLNWVSEYRPSELIAPCRVDHLLGACMLIRRSAWEQIGALDESYWLGVEETDWCYRARHAGWQIIYNPDFRVAHHGQKSLWQQPAQSLPRLYAGYIQFYRKHSGKRWEWALRGVLALGAMVRIGLWNVRAMRARAESRSKQARQMASGYWEVFRQLTTRTRAPQTKFAVAPKDAFTQITPHG